jgi:hypothetical protein
LAQPSIKPVRIRTVSFTTPLRHDSGTASLTTTNTWTTIAGVAGGWYNGQPFVRKGRFTQAIGTIGDPKLVALGGNPTTQDCGDRYNAYAFPLFNGGGDPVIGGDSGGPLMLAYFGGWYLAGITTAAGSPNNGQPTSGWSAVRDIPVGWTPCTAVNPCN